MKHVSIPIGPREFINITPLNPLLSKAQVKVMYVGEDPNRNRSIITKDVAIKMAASLPGSPIVGKYNREAEDFEQHNRSLSITEKGLTLVSDTFPYGFIPTDAKIWFEKFLDDGINEREYLMTEVVLWTGQFPEAQRIIDEGNNQSMELSDDEKYLNAHWTKDKNGKPQFFIINDAIFSKLCILGEEYEPCFEGAQIGKLDFDLGEDFKLTLFSMIDQFKNLYEGGQKMPEDIANVLEEPVIDTPVVEDPVAIVEEPVIDAVDPIVVEEPIVEENIDPIVEEPIVEDPQVEAPATATYTLEEIPEYTQLREDFNALEQKYSLLEQEMATMKTDYSVLKKFKDSAEDLQKDELIKSFYMLSDADKKPVVDKKAEYSLEEIESKLSVICVRNKVNFSAEDVNQDNNVYTYNMNNIGNNDDVPAWFKAVERTANKKQV